MAEMALSFTEVSKTFVGDLNIGRRRVLDGVTFSVPPGCVFGYLGPNGSGKTTSIKCALGLIFPDAGEIRLLGERAPAPASRREVAYLPEHPYFYDYLTGAEFVEFCGRLAGLHKDELRERVPAALERVGLKEAASARLRRYSKGMLQRAGLAQVLLTQPRLAVLDEPMSGLDPGGRRLVRDLILELSAGGCTVFFSSHILPDAEAICEQVAIISRGKIAAIGALHDLLRTEHLVFDVTLRGVPPPGHPLLARGRVSGERFLITVEGETALDALLDQIHEAKLPVFTVQTHSETLEELFLHTVEAAP